MVEQKAIPAEDLASEVAALRAELKALKAQKPTFVKMAAPQQTRQRTYVPPEELRTRGLAKGQTAGGQARWLDTPQGRAALPIEYRPVFNPGDLVRINPDAEIWGGEGKLWGEVLNAETSRTDGVGEVIGCMYSDHTWQPKYKVVVHGFTDANGDGFRESELLPYE